ncbi:efflux RND transporter periplasmic adaptor subunit [Myxococcus sp. Y35]|uniref:efflux RND transporter periplasmic adaptor subunit n=1 Tax=Pseudomyxococcus flavus TaxID=3115648 RepID=UPI003CEA53DE
MTLLVRRFVTVPLLLLGAACTSNPSNTPAPASEPPARASAPSAWVPVRAAARVALVEAPAVVLSAPDTTAALTAPFRARVQQVRARPGQQVRQGEALVEVLMPEVVEAAGAASAASLRLEAYARQVERLEALHAQGLAKLPELADAQTQHAEARAALVAAHAVLRVAGIGPGEARAVAERGTVWLKSPIDGVVTEVRAVLGEMQPEASTALVRVAADGPARLEARLSTRPPEGATFAFVSSLGAPVPVRLVGQSPQVDSADGTWRAWFEPEEGIVLRAGLGGRLRIHAAAGDDTVLVPARALAFENERTVVFTRGADGQPVRREVDVLATSGAEALVKGALSTGDAVAADGAVVLQEAQAEEGTGADGVTP